MLVLTPKKEDNQASLTTPRWFDDLRSGLHMVTPWAG